MTSMAERVVLRVMAAGAFEKMRDGKSVNFTAYRWEEGQEAAERFIQAFTTHRIKPQLFVTDDPNTWGDDRADTLIRLKVSLSKPFVILKDSINLEGKLNGSILIRIARANGYDAIVHTTENDIVGFRQALLLNAGQQVRSAEIV